METTPLDVSQLPDLSVQVDSVGAYDSQVPA